MKTSQKLCGGAVEFGLSVAAQEKKGLRIRQRKNKLFFSF